MQCVECEAVTSCGALMRQRAALADHRNDGASGGQSHRDRSPKSRKIHHLSVAKFQAQVFVVMPIDGC